MLTSCGLAGLRMAGPLVTTLWDLTTSGVHKCTGGVLPSQAKSLESNSHSRLSYGERDHRGDKIGGIIRIAQAAISVQI
jgi:hypothetical protein